MIAIDTDKKHLIVHYNVKKYIIVFRPQRQILTTIGLEKTNTILLYHYSLIRRRAAVSVFVVAII